MPRLNVLIFLAIWGWNVLKDVLKFTWYSISTNYYNAKLKEYKVNYLDNTSDFVSPDDFDGTIMNRNYWY